MLGATYLSRSISNRCTITLKQSSTLAWACCEAERGGASSWGCCEDVRIGEELWWPLLCLFQRLHRVSISSAEIQLKIKWKQLFWWNYNWIWISLPRQTHRALIWMGMCITHLKLLSHMHENKFHSSLVWYTSPLEQFAFGLLKSCQKPVLSL